MMMSPLPKTRCRMTTSFLAAALSVLLVAGEQKALALPFVVAKIWDVKSREAPPLPPITVAGYRIGFTRDPEDGRINAHFMEGFHPDQIEALKKYKPLGTLFF